MCYFMRQRATKRDVPRSGPVRAWKLVVSRGDDTFRSPLFYTTDTGRYLPPFKRGAWSRATAHGFYALKSRAECDKLRGDEYGSYGGCVVARVELAGAVREYRDGYRAREMRIVRVYR